MNNLLKGQGTFASKRFSRLAALRDPLHKLQDRYASFRRRSVRP